MTGAIEDRAATDWHDVGLHLLRNDAGELGFRVSVGGGMGRTPVIGTVMREFLPWNQIMSYVEAVVRIYNQYGHRDNKYKARIKILVKAESQRYIDEVEKEFRQIVEHDGGPHTIPQAELDRVSASFLPPALPERLEHARSADALATLAAQAEQAELRPMFYQSNVVTESPVLHRRASEPLSR
jgi:sulfite reductase (NADPH) hemoprotein beta-component